MRKAASFLAVMAFCLAAGANGRAAVGPEGASPSQVAQAFSVADLLNGKVMSADECAAIGQAVWVTADGASECLRYFMAAVAGARDAVVVLHGDFVDAEGDGAPKVTTADYARTTPADEEKDAAELAEHYGRGVIVLARPGTFGSSGNELKTRHTVHEARLMDAALDAIAARHGFARFHLVGQSGGSILIGALLAMRADIGCAAIGAGRLALAPYIGNPARLADANAGTPLDDQAYVETISRRSGLRVFVLSDPLDIHSAIAGQKLFTARALALGLPVRQLMTVAEVDRGAHHDVLGQALRVLKECIDGATDAQIAAIVDRFAAKNARKWARLPQAQRKEAAVAPSPGACDVKSVADRALDR